MLGKSLVSKLDDVKKCLVLPMVMMQPGQTILFIEVTAREELWGEGYRGIVMFGRSIARAFNRDSGVSIGEGISFLHGEVAPAVRPNIGAPSSKKGSTFILYDVPMGALELKNNYREYIDINVIQPSKEISVELLLKEKNRCSKALQKLTDY